MMKIGKIRAFAKKQGYDDVLYLNKWRGYDVYEPIFNNDEVHIIGVPLVILVKDNIIRMSTVEEAFQQLNESTSND